MRGSDEKANRAAEGDVGRPRPTCVSEAATITALFHKQATTIETESHNSLHV